MMSMKAGMVFVLALCVVSSCFADAGSGGQGGAFLRLAVGARPGGMGNAFVSVSDDANALYYNPGALYQIERYAVSATYSVMSMDRSHYQAGGVYSESSLGSFGLLINRFGVSDIDGRDIQGNPTGAFDDTELAISGSYGRQVHPYLGVGGSIKYISHTLEDSKATSACLDLGAHSVIDLEYGRLSSIYVGLSIANIGGELDWDTGSSHEDELPTVVRFGSSVGLVFEQADVLVALEGSHASDESTILHAGVEAWLSQVVAVRVGVDDEDFCFGGSVKYREFQFDYAYSEDVLEEGGTSKIGVQASF